MKKINRAVYTPQKLVDFLKEAASLPQNSIRDVNPFKFLGFDGSAPRLGWARKLEYSVIEEEMRKLTSVLSVDAKNRYLFLGMGGSINGVKVAQKIFSLKRVLPWDSLDFALYEDQVSADFFAEKDTLKLISLTKSGTTDETHLLAKAFSHVLREEPLWIVDDSSSAKLQNLLQPIQARTFSLQFDKNDDIGGRFSAPTTAVFMVPLFLDMKVEKIRLMWNTFLDSREQTMLRAAEDALRFKNKKEAYFAVKLIPLYAAALETWITQLFQESIGSKKEDLLVKTVIVDSRDNRYIPAGFDVVDMSMYGKDQGDIFNVLFYLQCFVAFFSCLKEINFVNQEYVEEYKRVLKELKKTADCSVPSPIGLAAFQKELSQKIAAQSSCRFIEAVYYGYLSHREKTALKKKLQQWFPQQTVFLFMGSDWNHHSYQAAFKASDTFFPILLPASYRKPAGGFMKEDLEKNITLLKQIACATYKTVSSKAGFYCLESSVLTA